MVLLPWVGGSGSSVPWVLLTLRWVQGLFAAGSGHIGCNHARIPIKAEGDFAGEGTATTDSSCKWLSAPLTGAAVCISARSLGLPRVAQAFPSGLSGAVLSHAETKRVLLRRLSPMVPILG